MTIHKDLLEEIINSWTEQQLDSYILKLELREVELHQWLKELRVTARLKKRALKKPVDTGVRSGT